MVDAMVSLLIQVPLVGVFVFFVLYMSRALLGHWEAREKAEAERRSAAMQHGLDAIDALASTHRDAVKTIAEAVGRVDERIVRHDAEEKERWYTLERHLLIATKYLQKRGLDEPDGE